jgi:hypothetical protein
VSRNGKQGVRIRILSGGQTGVDRGALEGALARGLPCGGWCPEGRRAEDGVIPERYPVEALKGAGYRERTERNVLDSDGTLILYFGVLSGGTAETRAFCERHGRPVLALDADGLSPEQAARRARAFVLRHGIATLNVAGPRASQAESGAAFARATVLALTEALDPS